MAFDIDVTNPRLHPDIVPHRIVPVRFARAVRGFAQTEAIDLDDHGFVIPAANCNALGPVAAVAQTKKIRIKVIRDRIEPTTMLFPKIEDESIATIEHPATGTALNATDDGERKADNVYINGVATGSTIQETKLKIHFGAADGPVLAEMAIRVVPRVTIRVQAHLVTINGTAPTTTMARVRSIFRRVNRIYSQAGVRFSLAGTAMNETVTGFARAGTVTLTNVADQRNVELQTVLRQNPVRNRLNAYFFRRYFDTQNTSGGPTGTFDQVLGIAFSRDDANANPPSGAFPGCQAGITMRDSGDIKEAAHTTAHEIGHALRLAHYGNASRVERDIWAQRCLMHNFINLTRTAPSSAARVQVGYGRYSDGRIMAGELLMTKRVRRIRQSNQVSVLRRAARNRSYAPV